MIRWEQKRAAEVRDYRHDWSTWLGDDTIVSSDWVATGITIDSEENDDTSVMVWLSGGTAGTVAQLSNTIVTDDGRTEVETFTLKICNVDEPVSLADVKAYLRILSSDEDAKVEAMIPRARAWVEDHTGLALIRREFVERQVPRRGAILLSRGPLVTVDDITFLSDGVETSYEPRFWPGQGTIFPAVDSSWPTLESNEQFTITYTAGYVIGEADDRLIGAMLALIEGEFAEGYAYPERAIQAATNCCSYLRPVI